MPKVQTKDIFLYAQIEWLCFCVFSMYIPHGYQKSVIEHKYLLILHAEMILNLALQRTRSGCTGSQVQ